MKEIYRLLSWTCFYLGDISSEILELFDSEFWCGTWYPVYNKFMCWSGDLQDAAGFDPNKVENTDGWPWEKPKLGDKEE